MTYPNLDKVRGGIRSVYKMDLTDDPKKRHVRLKNTPDVNDIIEALTYVSDLFEETRSYVDKKLKRGSRKKRTNFTYVDDIKNLMHDIFLGGDTDKEIAFKRFRNKALFVLVIEPLLESFRPLKHSEALQVYKTVLDEVRDCAVNDNTISNPIDDFVIRKMIAKAQ